MKKVTLTMAGLALVALVLAQEIAWNRNEAIVPLNKAAAFVWESSTTADLGVVESGTSVAHEFTFWNDGENPLIITSVQASCGCTVASYSKDAIPAGQYGFVKAVFNAKHPGEFNKTVTLTANTDDGTTILTLKGKVVK